jgi:hypothetical protein
MKKLIPLFLACSLLLSCTARKAYLFTSFREPATAGMRLLYSKDGYAWTDLDTTFIRPVIGDKVMRDPSIVQGPDGTFHLVWTSAWKGNKSFGYAHSRDLVNWSEQTSIEVMKHEPTVVNVWAPELFYDADGQQFIIIWASTIPFRFAKGIEEEENNHRMYYTTTKDFKTFSETKLFLDPGFSVIDAVIVKRGQEDFVLVLKDNTRPNRNMKVAFGKTPLGTWSEASPPFTPNFTEGPSVVKVKDDYLIYFDSYREKIYGAVRTKDFKNFEDITRQVSVPAGHKHGTIFSVPVKTIRQLKKSVRR